MRDAFKRIVGALACLLLITSGLCEVYGKEYGIVDVSNNQYSNAISINNNGIILGGCAQYGLGKSFVWNREIGFRDLELDDSRFELVPCKINNLNQVICSCRNKETHAWEKICVLHPDTSGEYSVQHVYPYGCHINDFNDLGTILLSQRIIRDGVPTNDGFFEQFRDRVTQIVTDISKKPPSGDRLKRIIPFPLYGNLSWVKCSGREKLDRNLRKIS